jgi:Bacterial Ig-like domain (group 2)
MKTITAREHPRRSTRERSMLVSLTCFVALAAAMPGRAQDTTYVPVATSGYSQDAIAEDSPALDHTTGTLDGSDYVVYSVAYGSIFGTGTGLPDDGQIVQGARTYQLQPYTADNVLTALPGATATLVPASPDAYTSISLLAFATEGSATGQVVLGFDDATSATFPVTVPDWFSDGSPVISGFDRTGRLTNAPDFLATEPNMYALDLPVACSDQGKAITSIGVTNQTGGVDVRFNVFAVSGAPSVAAVTGATQVVVGQTIALADATPGGAWSSSDVAIATVAVDGTVTGVAPGDATIAYAVPLGCGTVQRTHAITVVADDTIFADGFDGS